MPESAYEAFASRYKADPADPTCASDLAKYTDGWDDAMAAVAPTPQIERPALPNLSDWHSPDRKSIAALLHAYLDAGTAPLLAEIERQDKRAAELEALLSRAHHAMDEWQIAHTLRGEIRASLSAPPAPAPEAVQIPSAQPTGQRATQPTVKESLTDAQCDAVIGAVQLHLGGLRAGHDFESLVPLARNSIRAALASTEDSSAVATQPAGQEALRQDALCDAAYVAGARAGFNAAASSDPEALNKLIATRAGYIPVLKATRSAQAGGGKP